MSIHLHAADNGFYRTPAAVPESQWREIDLRRVRGKRGLLTALARSLHFPDTFGGNWDALTDALQDLSWLEGGVLCHLRAYDRFRAAAPADAAMLEDILGECAQYWRGRQRLFVVIADGAVAPLPPAPQ